MLAKRGVAFNSFRQEVEQEVRYANIAIIEGIGASQYGVGMVAARVAEVVLRGERAVFPVGSHNARYDVALSLPRVVGGEGVSVCFTVFREETNKIIVLPPGRDSLIVGLFEVFGLSEREREISVHENRWNGHLVLGWCSNVQ